MKKGILLALMVCATSIYGQGLFSDSGRIGTNNYDAAVGLDTSKSYTHAWKLNKTTGATINSVPFTGTTSRDVAGAFKLDGLVSSNNGYNPQLAGTGFKTLCKEFFYGGNPGTLTLRGLIPGNLYEVTVYDVAWENYSPNRNQIMTSACGSSYLYSLNGPKDYFGLMRYLFRASSAAADWMRFNNTVSGTTYHFYGFSVENVSASPYINTWQGANEDLWTTSIWSMGDYPNSADAIALFEAKVNPTAVTIDQPVRLRGLHLAGPGYTFNGTSPLTFNQQLGGAGYIETGAGEYLFNAPVVVTNGLLKFGAGDVTFAGGLLTTNASFGFCDGSVSLPPGNYPFSSFNVIRNDKAFCVSNGMTLSASLGASLGSITNATARYLQTGGTATFNGAVRFGDSPFTRAFVELTAGLLSVTSNATFGNGTNSYTSFVQSGGTATFSGNTHLGGAAATDAYMGLSNGALNISEFKMNGDYATNALSLVNVTGGTLTVGGFGLATHHLLLAWGLGGTLEQPEQAHMNILGGTLNANKAITPSAILLRSNNSRAVVTIGDGGRFSAVNAIKLSNGNVASRLSVVNLNENGLLETPELQNSGAVSPNYLNFNGGKVKGTTALTVQSNILARVWSKGGTFEQMGNGYLRSALLAPQNKGVTNVVLVSQGGGYSSAPLVVFPSEIATSLPATGYAVMESDGAGTLRVASVAVTCPGEYTTDVTPVLRGGNSTNPAVAATVLVGEMVDNVSGGMTFAGSGKTLVQTACSYIGATVISGGTVELSPLGTLNGSTQLTLQAGSKFVAKGLVTNTVPIILAGGVFEGVTESNLTLTIDQALPGTRITAPITADTLTIPPAVGGDKLLITVTLSGETAWALGATYKIFSYKNIAGSFDDLEFELSPALDFGFSFVPEHDIANKTIGVRIVGTVPVLAWDGAADGHWNLAETPFNWNGEAGLTNYINGTITRFFDTATDFTVAIMEDVSPLAVYVENSAANPYTFTGAAITSGYFRKTGTGDLIFAATNSSESVMDLLEGRLILGDGVLDAAVMPSINIAATATNIFNTASSQAYAGTLSGNGAVIKSGPGVLTFSGTNAMSTLPRVVQGILNWTATNTVSTPIYVGCVSNQSARLDVPSRALDTMLYIGAYPMQGGSGWTTNTAGAVYQTGGKVISSGGGFGFGINAYGSYTLSGGTLVFTGQPFFGGTDKGGFGLLDVIGGEVYVTQTPLVLSFTQGDSAPNFGALNIRNGGSLTLQSTSNPLITCRNANGKASVTVEDRGTLVSTNGIKLGNQSSATIHSVVNINSNGLIQTKNIVETTPGLARSTVNFNGGTLKATDGFTLANSIDFVFAHALGGVIDNNGVAISLSKPVVTPEGYFGVASISVTHKGSGYIGAPIVYLPVQNDTMATAYAIMEDDETGNNTFRIKEIVVSSPGRYTAADPAQGVTLYGGNPVAPAVVSAVMAATVSGGMTFTGSGTTSLGGTNTYTGDTVILAGTLTLGAGVTLSATREVVVHQALFNSGTSFARPILLNGGTLSGSSTLSLAGTGTVFNAAVTGAVAPGMEAGDIAPLLFTGTSALAPGATVYLDVTPTVSDKLEFAASVSTTFTGVNFTLNAPELLRRATHYTILSSASGSLSTLPVITNLPEGWLVEEEAGNAVLVFRGNTVLQFM